MKIINKLLRSLLAVGVLCLFLLGGEKVQAQSGLMFSPSFLYYSYEEQINATQTAEVRAQYFDIRLGYIMGGGIYFGGLYSTMDRDQGGTDQKRSSYGPSFGIIYNQFFLIGHYILSSEYEVSSGTELKEGTGTQFELGYLFNVTGRFYAGPQMVIRKIDYKKIGTLATSGATDVDETLPYVTLAFIF